MRDFTPAQCLLLLASLFDLAQARVPRIPRARILRPRDTTYTTSIRDPTTNQQFGSVSQLTTVNAGVTRWLSGLGTHNFYGNVNNYGQIIISQTDWLATHSAGGQTSDWSGHTTTDANLNNYAGSSISLNDFGSDSAPTYDWDMHTFTNYGSLQMCGRGDTGGSTYQLYCDIDCYNYGVIDMEQYYGALGASFVWRNTNLYAPGSTTVYNTYNQGAFRIINVVYHNVQNVLGNGCYIIGANATLYLEDGSGYFQNVNFGPTFPGQTITFSDATGVLHMDTQVYSHNSNFGPPVYGFGGGNVIEFYEHFPSTNVYSYDSGSGILTVNFISGNKVYINIGTGYDATQFTVGTHSTLSVPFQAIRYNLAAPAQSVPSVCSVSLGVCQNPVNTAGPYASSTSATGYVTTTVPYSGAGTVTGPVTSTITPSGTVSAPGPFVTLTSYSNGAAAASTTTVGQAGTIPGTVIVVQPATYATSTVFSNVASPFTTTIPQTGTAPGTVLVVDPVLYTTVTSYSNVPAAFTTTIPQTDAGPGTVVVVDPAQYNTITTYSNVPAAFTTTISQVGTTPGTVLVVDPAQYTTITTNSDVPAAFTTTIPQAGTTPGTVLVVDPIVYVTVTTASDGASSAFTSTVPPSGTAPGTVLVVTPTNNNYVTTSVPYTGTGFLDNPITTTIPPSGTAPGTVEVFTPTVTRPSTIATNIGPNTCICRPVPRN